MNRALPRVLARFRAWGILARIKALTFFQGKLTISLFYAGCRKCPVLGDVALPRAPASLCVWMVSSNINALTFSQGKLTISLFRAGCRTCRTPRDDCAPSVTSRCLRFSASKLVPETRTKTLRFFNPCAANQHLDSLPVKRRSSTRNTRKHTLQKRFTSTRTRL